MSKLHSAEGQWRMLFDRSVGVVQRTLQQTVGLFLSERRDLQILLGAALVLHLVVWISKLFWYQFNPLIAIFGLALFLLNMTLSVVFASKDRLITQAIAITAIVVQALLLVLLFRTGALGL